MAEQIPVEQVADAMYALIAECAGKRNLKPGDVIKAMIAKYGEESCSRETCKLAIRVLIESSRCVYSCLGGSYIQLPPKEDAAGAN